MLNPGVSPGFAHTGLARAQHNVKHTLLVTRHSSLGQVTRLVGLHFPSVNPHITPTGTIKSCSLSKFPTQAPLTTLQILHEYQSNLVHYRTFSFIALTKHVQRYVELDCIAVNLPGLLQCTCTNMKQRENIPPSTIMKPTAILKATGLAYLVGALAVMATPARVATIEARQFVPITMGIEGVLKYATETLAIQIEGAATNLNQLKKWCKNAGPLTSRLAQQGYNATFITNSICAASKAPTLKTDAQIRNLTQEAATRIWVVQALGSTLGNAKLLCKCTLLDSVCP